LSISATVHVQQTPWGKWFGDLIRQPQLDQYDIAEMNLRCAVDLPWMKREWGSLWIDKINDWTDWWLTSIARLAKNSKATKFDKKQGKPSSRSQGFRRCFRVGKRNGLDRQSNMVLIREPI